MMNVNRESMCVVDYMSGSSMIHEFMSENDYADLLKLQKHGMVKIFKHENLSCKG